MSVGARPTAERRSVMPLHSFAPSDYLGFGAAAAFGIWWMALPRSVIAFYAWFHRGRVKLPSPSGVRIAGAIWTLLMLGVLVLGRSR